MWYAGASQGNGAAYLLCFVLASLCLVSAVHAWINLRGIQLEASHIPPAFAGEELDIRVLARNTQRRAHFGLHLRIKPHKLPGIIPELAGGSAQPIEIKTLAARRGRYDRLAIVLTSSYPLGFCTAQQEQIVEQIHYIYPAPRGEAPLPRSLEPTRQPRGGTRTAGDDYGGVRAWQPGESQRHIDWKAAARGQTLLTKQWTGEVDEILRLDWHHIATGNDTAGTEARLSQLAKWVVLAERSHSPYELRLPGKIIPASRGSTHYHACLRALAEFENGRPSPIA